VRGQDSHAPDDVLEQYSLGTLPEAEAELLEEHLLICQECRDRLEETDAFVDATRKAAQALEAGRSSSWDGLVRRLRWLAQPLPAAAAILAVALLVWLVRPYGGLPAAPAAVLLESTRGAAGGPPAPASRPLILLLDVAGVPGSPSYHVEVVDRTGAGVSNSAARRSGDQIAFRTGPLSQGRYWVRVYSPSRELLREYGLDVK
jgi:hypothetical protein